MPDKYVAAIHIAPAASRPMVSVERVLAIPGKGLEGDRYFDSQGTFFKNKKISPDKEVTLIEQEALEALRDEYKLELLPHESRRNILTKGAALNHLVGREFRVGKARLRGIRLCEPCKHLEKLTGRSLKGLVHRGGLRAQVLQEGEISVGDEIVVLESRGNREFSEAFLNILECLGGKAQ
jgi:MOSC domain-containing protein YiiM